jgi:hypothetical protein
MSVSKFDQAVDLARSGKKREARDLFWQVLQADRTNEMAWLWYAECVDTSAERLQALEICLRLNPQAQRVRFALTVAQNSSRPSVDPHRTQRIIIQPADLAEEKKGLPPLSDEAEWALSTGSGVFTVPPDMVDPEDFARIEESTEAFLLKNPDMKLVFRRTEDWSELSARPTAAREPRTRPRQQTSLVIPNTGSPETESRRGMRGAVFALVLVALMFALLAGVAIMFRVL